MIIQCTQCGVDVNKPPSQIKLYSNQFCGNSCSAKYNKNGKKQTIKPKKEKLCAYCDEAFTSKDKKSKYCSVSCGHSYKRKLDFQAWLQGSNPKSGPIKLKKFLVMRDTYKCSNCSITEWDDKPIVLELEHKDGNSENNTQANLCLLCPNCHSQTDTYKAKNTGNGRHKRRQRYAEGKSY